MQPVEAVLIGAGGRGINAFGAYALRSPHDLRFVAVAEPNDERRAYFAEQHHIPKDRQFKDHTGLLEKGQLAEVAVNTTMDRTHVETTLPVLEAGYHVLLEKPMANDAADCVRLVETARRKGRLLLIGYGMRYMPFFIRIRQIIEEGRIGRVVAMHHQENVSYWHHVTSFVRGHHSRDDEGSPMILQKSCHDMDAIRWLVDSRCERVSSFGGLSVFREGNAPEGAPARCTDGCPVEAACPYSALKVFFSESMPDWIIRRLGLDLSHEGRMKALREGPQGRCAYRCNNNVVDHQIVNLEFSNGVKAGFTMWGLSHENTRTLRIAGEEATLRGHMKHGEIELHHYNSGDVERTRVGTSAGGHSGGDYNMMKAFCAAIRNGDFGAVMSSAEGSLESHLMAFAAETSRLQGGRVVEMSEFREEIDAAKAEG